jgi:protein gp37
MSEVTEISWSDSTFNPWAGCTKVSPACDNCYAEKDTAFHKYVVWGKDAPRRRTSVGYWNQLEKWNRTAAMEPRNRRVFIGSWCDIMETTIGSVLAPRQTPVDEAPTELP